MKEKNVVFFPRKLISTPPLTPTEQQIEECKEAISSLELQTKTIKLLTDNLFEKQESQCKRLWQMVDRVKYIYQQEQKTKKVKKTIDKK